MTHCIRCLILMHSSTTLQSPCERLNRNLHYQYIHFEPFSVGIASSGRFSLLFLFLSSTLMRLSPSLFLPSFFSSYFFSSSFLFSSSSSLLRLLCLIGVPLAEWYPRGGEQWHEQYWSHTWSLRPLTLPRCVVHKTIPRQARQQVRSVWQLDNDQCEICDGGIRCPRDTAVGASINRWWHGGGRGATDALCHYPEADSPYVHCFEKFGNERRLWDILQQLRGVPASEFPRYPGEVLGFPANMTEFIFSQLGLLVAGRRFQMSHAPPCPRSSPWMAKPGAHFHAPADVSWFIRGVFVVLETCGVLLPSKWSHSSGLGQLNELSCRRQSWCCSCMAYPCHWIC